MVSFELVLIGLLTGTLIGSVGVGGILLAPLLTSFTGLSLHLALAVSSWSFLFTGVVGTFLYARKKIISWQAVGWLSIGIVPAALLGAWINVLLPASALTLILATLIVFSGIYALFNQTDDHEESASLKPVFLLLIGVGVGFGSALTGTGGPVLLIPILLFLKMPVLLAVGIGQVVQIPIASFSSVGFVLYGQTDFALGTTLGLIQAAGVGLGALIAHRLPAKRLRQVVAFALVGVGVYMIGRTVFSFMS